MLGEIRNNLKPTEVFEKPDVLDIIETCRAMRISRVDADYEHQPYIWMLEFKTAIQEEDNFKVIADSSGATNNGIQPT